MTGKRRAGCSFLLLAMICQKIKPCVFTYYRLRDTLSVSDLGVEALVPGFCSSALFWCMESFFKTVCKWEELYLEQHGKVMHCLDSQDCCGKATRFFSDA